MRNHIVGIVIFLAASLQLLAQDLQFSQYYSAPLYLNPALTGINQHGRMGVNYRNQWPSIESNFETFSAFFDYNAEDYNSSVGFMVISDRAGLGGLTATTLSLQYAYQLQLDYNWFFRPAFDISYSFKDIDYNNLIFGDQIDINGGVNPVTGEPLIGGRISHPDLGLGGLFFSQRSWIGVALHHILRPDQAFIGTNESRLPQKFTVHGGYKIPIGGLGPRKVSSFGKKEKSISPTFYYRSQNAFKQLDIGSYVTLDPFIFGLWYRGLPVFKKRGFSTSESIVAMVGITANKTSFGYSYDYTISKLGPRSGGAHEISIIHQFRLADPSKPSRNSRELRCPVPFLF